MAEGLESRIFLSSTHLVFVAPLGIQTTAGVVINGSQGIQVAIEGSTNTPIAGDNSVVTLALGGGKFVGGSTPVSAAAVNGVATFTGLAVESVGTYTLTASDVPHKNI